MKKINKVRFNALAGYTRNSGLIIGEETGWYEKENILGVIFFDYVDELYNIIILGQDENLRFRCVDLSCNFNSEELAEKEIQKKLNYWTKQPKSILLQGDIKREILDVFNLLVPEENLNSYFKTLFDNKDYLPAKQLISYLMRYYETYDVGFVNQFQTDGFHSRIWELYLYAMLSEIGFSFEKNNKVDFLCRNINGEIAIEATAINPDHLTIQHMTPEDVQENIEDIDRTCIRINNVLMRKLKKEYWKSLSDSIPLVIAIQAFHYPYSSQVLVLPLMQFLYGERLIKNNDIYQMINIDKHKWRNKNIKSNFFEKQGVENISAVICNTQGTLPKFNRMGIVAGFKCNRKTKILRRVTFIKNGDWSRKITKLLDVRDSSYSETWAEGLNVFHNPNAKIPLDPIFFPNAYHYYKDKCIYPSFYVVNSDSRRFKNT